ncbi:hypothetical protein [Amycolatopsis sp. FDAARGOS 1241]|uniref:hypothetical protein n=1 Tax=Amycolatopsis sp. FDAARGOS 1241 TaxID=2778070 RepID=UPI001951A375|nr:hypothetical protein [Amycolatopsis sp. FDAARGOS 1241]QRP48487.1 hypothetical protein I6J71_11945 [Amycolatopsis sp. FDAARGOS 1241]
MARFVFHDAGTARIKVDLTRRTSGDGSHPVLQTVRQVAERTGTQFGFFAEFPTGAREDPLVRAGVSIVELVVREPRA